ncbi:MAG: TonB-dependent receptor [Steroidobacteraceae bacterium]|nr:TonB-dependent receptor [Steroidobacteraceae bacterium]
MQRLPRSILGAAIAAILAAPTVTLAQSADATLRGTAPADSDVTAKNVATGATRRTKAGSDGSYTFAGLQPGTYRVDAGAGSEQVVTLSVASTATLDLTTGDATATVEAPMQEVVVQGRRLNEVRTSEVGTTVSLQQIETTPQMTRNFLEFADTVPGVVFEVDSSGRTSIRGGAQNENGVNLYIDGVGQKGYVRSGISGQAGDTQGNPFPQLAIGEYKVITSNYKAEYDQISSAAITAVTRSGTNNFEGQAFGTFTQDNWRARTPGEKQSNIKSPSESREYGFAFGGPIIQDSMHFFLTYEAKRFQTPKTVTAGGNAPANIVAQLPANATEQLGAATIGFDEDLIFGKLSWEPTESDRFEMSAKFRDEVGQGSQAGVGVAQSAAVDTDNDDKRYEASWQRTGGRWVNELQFTYEDAFFVPQVINPDQNGLVYTWRNQTLDQNILAIDGADPRAGQNKGQKGWAIGDTITFTDINWFGGDHTVKAGIKYKKVELTAADSVPGRPVFFFDVSPTGVAPTPWKAAIALPVTGYPTTAISDAKQLGVFIQDDWEVNDKLTLNLGVRWDFEENPSYHDNVTPQFIIDSFNTVVPMTGLTYAQRLAQSTDPDVRIDVNDYISTGNNRKPYKNAFQPRLGFSYDFGADQQHVLFGGAGRAYDRTLYDYLQLEQTKFALATADVRFNTVDHSCTVDGTNCVNWDPAFATDPSTLVALFGGRPGEIDLINNDLRIPYSDQISLGMRNRLGDWNTSVAVSRIESHDGFVFTLGNRHEDGAFFDASRSQPWGGDDAPPGLGSLIIGNSGIETKSTQLLVSFEKPFDRDSKWGSTLSYTFTRAKQNRDINEHYLFDASSINAFPFIDSNAAPKHRVVATGSYQGPWGLMFAGKAVISTPSPRNVISCIGAPNTFPGGGACNPFAYTLGTSEGYRALDLQMTKNFEVGDIGSMYVRLDVLNVTNEENLVDYFEEIFNGTSATGRLNPDGNITGFPRTLRASFGVKF